MRKKTISEVLALGAAPGRGLKASMGEWLGQAIGLDNHSFWSSWMGGGVAPCERG